MCELVLDDAHTGATVCLCKHKGKLSVNTSLCVHMEDNCERQGIQSVCAQKGQLMCLSLCTQLMSGCVGLICVCPRASDGVCIGKCCL